uniref:L-serine deaminase n=1 Tax=Anser brachyrhynchus TaxID=132585 RepID=A0A8B9CMN4_9AVES
MGAPHAALGFGATVGPRGCALPSSPSCFPGCQEGLPALRVFLRGERWHGCGVRGQEAGAAGHRGGAQQHRARHRAQAAGAGGDGGGLRQGRAPTPQIGAGGGGNLNAHGPSIPPKKLPPASGFGYTRGDKGHISGAGAPGLDAAPLSTPRAPQVWDEANRRALELADTPGWVSVHPFDHPLVWQGHASLVRELKDSLEAKPDAIVLAVGGGGLLAGVVAGLQQVGWPDVPIIAAETWGAHSFHAALEAGRLVTLPDITSVAKCLGAQTVSARALECAQESRVISQVVEDAEAVRAVERFLDDERMLVQPACGAALALLYSGRLQRLQREGRLGTPLGSVVLVVCGGSSITAAQLRGLKSQLGLE